MRFRIGSKVRRKPQPGPPERHRVIVFPCRRLNAAVGPIPVLFLEPLPEKAAESDGKMLLLAPCHCIRAAAGFRPGREVTSSSHGAA